jgi:hypothetical protein
MKRNILFITFMYMAIASACFAQVPYGNNPDAGYYFTLKDGTKLYYEVYGKGKPFVLLHGGVFGYIDEFEFFIPRLAEKF